MVSKLLNMKSTTNLLIALVAMLAIGSITAIGVTSA